LHRGGQPPIDPKSSDPSSAEDTKDLTKTLNYKLNCKTQLADVKQADYDAVFYPGGHGPLWDLATDASSSALIEAFIRITNLLLLYVIHQQLKKT
jgi:putative intracellular protease/amidase